MKAISREEARKLGSIKYYTGKPCIHGHDSPKYVRSNWCCECARLFNKKQRDKHKGESSPSTKRWRAKNREKLLETKRKKERERRSISREIERERRKSDTQFLVKKQAQNMLHRTLRATNSKKVTRTEVSLGYSGEDLRKHIEGQFRPGMCWGNFGRGPGFWNIDHIKPVMAFVKEGESDPSVINALPNLQPLWFEENSQKSDRW